MIWVEEKFDSLYSKERIRERMFLLTLSCHLSCDMNRVLLWMTRVDCETKANVRELEFGVRGEKELFFGDKKKHVWQTYHSLDS